MAKAAKKARGKFVDEKYLGSEPDLSGKIPSATDMAKAYNWYNYFYNNDDAKGFVLEYLKSNHKNEKDLIRGISSDVPADRLRTLGWSARILTMGGNLQSGYDFIAHAKKTVESVRTSERTGRFVLSSPESGSISEDDRMGETTDSKESDAESTSSQSEKISIQDRIKNKTSDLIAELEDEIDNFINKGESKFKIAEWLRQKDVKPQIALRIADFYKPLYSELFDAYEGKDEELKKAYKRYKKPELRAYMEFVRDIVSACENRAEIVKVIRKPRKKKQKTPQQLVSRLKYKEKDDEYNLVSVKPTEIIGSNQLWVFNTKNRQLMVYNAMGPAGLNIKGSTVTGYDEKISIVKTLRKPADTLKDVVSGGKVTLRKAMDSIRTKPRTANGRINPEMILLRVIK